MKPPDKPATKKEANKAVRKAKKALQNAKNAAAETIEPFKFENVKTLVDQADVALGNKNYDEARDKAYKGEAKARELAISASKKKSQAEIDKLKEQLENKDAKEVIVTLEGSIVGFEYASDKLNASSLPTLGKIARILNQHPEYAIVIIGHTDSEGSGDYNQKLSERRAQSVLNYMKTQSVDPKRMTKIGRGEDRPVADNVTPEGRAKNRRVEFQLLK
ncbi:MAG: OmpA family protein [Planctomycetaceae bacterium]|nr:OmpA family protein [Planctomycetaceae bacterium]